jgi:hypothetical protein
MAATSRAARKPVTGRPSAKLALLQSVIADARFASLSARAGQLVLVCLLEWGDGAGNFWAKSETVASFLKINEKTVRRGLDEAVEKRILERTRHQRPDGTFGTYTYSLPADISVRWSPSPADKDVRASSADKVVHWPSADKVVRAELDLEQERTDQGADKVRKEIKCPSCGGGLEHLDFAADYLFYCHPCNVTYDLRTTAA